MATSAADFGGLNGLIAAARKEGTLNVITLPDNWANYGTIMKDFSAKYGIKINSENPDGSSQDELNAVNQTKGLGMVVIIAIVMACYVLLQRRAARWLR